MKCSRCLQCRWRPSRLASTCGLLFQDSATREGYHNACDSGTDRNLTPDSVPRSRLDRLRLGHCFSRQPAASASPRGLSRSALAREPPIVSPRDVRRFHSGTKSRRQGFLSLIACEFGYGLNARPDSFHVFRQSSRRRSSRARDRTTNTLLEKRQAISLRPKPKNRQYLSFMSTTSCFVRVLTIPDPTAFSTRSPADLVMA
jgi:hypothetical protein